MLEIRFILLLLLTFNVYADNDLVLKRQAALNFLNATGGDFNEQHEQFIHAIQGQFDLYLRKHPDITENDIAPYKPSVHISTDELLDYEVTILFEESTISELREITEFSTQLQAKHGC